MSGIPKSHPRYASLVLREKIAACVQQGIVHETGLIAHGRGEAFDYLLGEKTTSYADVAEKVAAAALLQAARPVISINGNVAALVPEELIKLAERTKAKMEVNLFHRTEQRMNAIIAYMNTYGGTPMYGATGDALIPGLDHDRAICDKQGIFSSDVLLVPLEDGDRCKALKNMGKTVIVIDLNPLSRSAKMADVTIVDNVIRAIPGIIKWVDKLNTSESVTLQDMLSQWDNTKNLLEMLKYISQRLNNLFSSG
jgi:4-phosphopantoate--beta-alanine ligase